MADLPPRILVVDDDADTRNMVRELLSTEGYDVLTAADGRDGLRKASDFPPDLVLLDLRMPGVDGMQALPLLRRAAPSVPILVFTAYGDWDLLQAVLQLGAQNLVAKPFKTEELLAEVSRILGARRGNAGARS